MYNISDFLHFPARNKMYEGAARVHFISAGKKKKKSEMLYITWLNVVGVIPLLQLQKVKCIAGSKKYCFRTDLIHLKLYFYSLQYILVFATVIKCITKTILNFLKNFCQCCNYL